MITNMKEINFSRLLIFLSFSINGLLVIGYIYTWYKGYFLLPDDWTWGENLGNSGYWSKWGYNEVYGYLFFLPLLTGIGSLFTYPKFTIASFILLVFSVLMFYVALQHFWLID